MLLMTSTEIGFRKNLPTMYDLPSECAGDPGLPDEFHSLQPRLLDRALVLPNYPRDRWFSAMDMHLYYDASHTGWYKRPDWFLVVDVPRRYEGRDARQSYVVWQEKEVPRLAIEFLSPGTEAEDLGRFYDGKSTISSPGRPPGKFIVYEEILRVPHYVIFDAQTQALRYFRLAGTRYQEQAIADLDPRIWFSDLQVGLSIWEGTIEGLQDRWLRWCDAEGNWLRTDTEVERQQRERAEVQAERERQLRQQAEARADLERQRRERAEARL